MSGVKHTPGPWKIVRGELVGANGRRVVEYGSGCAFMCGGPDEESVANAQLRNAAPDLLEALIEARLTLSLTRTNIMVEMKKSEGAAYRWEGVPELLANRIAQCDAAIARARGES